MVASRFRRWSTGIALMGAALAATSSQALTINLIDVGGVAGSPAQQGFAIAARYWESVLVSNATMNINVSFASLGAGILGSTGTSLYTYVPVDTYKTLLAGATSGSVVDTLAVAALPPTSASGSLEVTVPGYYVPATQSGIGSDAAPRIAPDGTAISDSIAIASSNVKALMNDASFGANAIDANIQFSSNFAFDFDPTDGIAAGRYDFIGVAVHEIGHALGFLSGVEDFDASADDASFNPDEYWWGYAGDLFRYSAPGKLDWTFGTDSYFSLDGGVTAYQDGYWSTGSNFGDGWQASHWKSPAGEGCANFRGIMNPYICSGLTDSVTALDVAYLDAIGWNTNFDAGVDTGYSFSTAQMYRAFAGAVPEPATWAQMLLGFGLAGAAVRRRRQTGVAIA